MEMFMVKLQPNEKDKQKNILITSAVAKSSSNQFIVANFLWKQCDVSQTEQNKKTGGFT